MKNNYVSLLSATAAVALATFAAAPVMAADQATMDKPAGSVTAVTTLTATVINVDKKDRWVTLEMADGTRVDIQAGPAVKNFAQIKKGDKVTATQEQTMTIAVVAGGQAPPNVSGGTAVVTAPLGSKPMAVGVDTTVVSGKVTAIDYTKRSVTLLGPLGNSRTLTVGPGVQKFNAVKLGDDVVLTLKTAAAIEVTTPTKGAAKP